MTTKRKPVARELLERLKGASSATIAGVVCHRRGYRFIYMGGVLPLRPGTKMVGTAVTLRYLPWREDHETFIGTPKAESYAEHVAIETVGEGDVLVVDARGNTKAGIFGDILASRLVYRGGAGLVTDGAIRDVPYLRSLNWPIFVRAPHGYAHIAEHWAADVNLPIACGGVLVEPGDILVGDDDGVAVIPQQIAEEVAEEALNIESREAFAREIILEGASISEGHAGARPFLPEIEKKYEEWLRRQKS